MSKIRTYINNIMALVAVMMFGLSSCVYDDISDCPSTRQIRIVLNEQASLETMDVRENIIPVATIFVYDEESNFVHSRRIENLVLGQEYIVEATIFPKKEYNFIVWGNHDTPFYLKNENTNTTNAVFGLDVPADGMRNQTFPHIYYGKSKVQNIGKVDIVNIDLGLNTYDINLKVTGLAPATEDYDFTCTIQDNNQSYNFENNYIASNPIFNYTADAVLPTGNDSFTSLLRVLKLDSTRSPRLIIKNETTGDVLYPRNADDYSLVDLINHAYNDNGQVVDYNKKHFFDVEVILNPDLSLTIKIDNWTVINSDESLQD